MNLLFSCRAVDQEHLGQQYASASNLLEPGAEKQAIGGISIFSLRYYFAECFMLKPEFELFGNSVAYKCCFYGNLDRN